MKPTYKMLCLLRLYCQRCWKAMFLTYGNFILLGTVYNWGCIFRKEKLKLVRGQLHCQKTLIKSSNFTLNGK